MEKKIKSYTILKKSYASKLVDTVGKYIIQGRVPLGGVSVS